MSKGLKKHDLYKYAAIALTILATVYLGLFLYNSYATFHEYSDLGVMAYNIYFNIHYPQIAHGLQYIVFGNHISPDMLLILPLFHLYESSLTLLFIQLLYVYIAGIAVFLIARNLTKSNLIGFVLSMAFLIFPGNIGQVVFDAHIEFPITIFYLLTFYYYMKSRFYKFFISSVLLLGSTEVTPILGIGLGIGLLLYEYRYNKAKTPSNTKKTFALTLIALSILATLFYVYVTSTLAHSYTTSYKNLYPIFYVTGGPQVGLGSSVIKFITNPISQLSYDINLYLPSYTPYLVYSILLILFGFGVSLFFIPDIAFVLLLPWLSGVLVFQYSSFLLPLSEYFVFVTGPVICTSIIGILISKKKSNHLSKMLRKTKLNKERSLALLVMTGSILLSILSPLIYFYIVSPLSRFHSINVNDLQSLLTLQPNQTKSAYYSQLYSVIKQVPSNASLLTEYFIMPHVIKRESLDFVPNRIAFIPDYILVDFNRNISNNICNSGFENCTAFANIINNGNYSLYVKNGTATLYKRNG